MRAWLLAAGALGVVLSAGVQAMDLRPDAIQVQAGGGFDDASVIAAGVVWEWGERRPGPVRFSGQTEFVLSHWRTHAVGGGHQGLLQLALVPVLRMVLDHGRSPWYLEAGIGASWLDRDYATPGKSFGSRWNFYDMLGGGYRFGADARQEIGLRYVHVSNADLKRPNPGEDLLLLRYAWRF